MIPVQKLIDLFQQMYKEHWRYEWGKAEKGCVDCSGAFVYAYNQYGLSCPHGSNAMARKKTLELLPITEAKPGMVAYKAREPDEDYYDLPQKYHYGGESYNGDLNDYYHVGLVDNDTNYVLNAKGTSYGFSRDKISQGWDFVGYLKDVDYGEEKMNVTYQAVVVGGNLNMRSKPDVNSDRVCQIQDGAVVTVTEDLAGWSKVTWGTKSGYVMTKYLEEITLDRTTVTVERADLEKVYDMVGSMLGLRG